MSVLLALALAGCSSQASGSANPAPTPTLAPAPTVVPTPIPTVVPTAVPTVAPTATPELQTVQKNATDDEETLISTGEVIFQETAGGIGCQFCHGRDARGDIGPNIRGKTAEAIEVQFEINAQMSFIDLTDKEIEAVGAYLQWLATQP